MGRRFPAGPASFKPVPRGRILSPDRHRPMVEGGGTERVDFSATAAEQARSRLANGFPYRHFDPMKTTLSKAGIVASAAGQTTETVGLPRPIPPVRVWP